MNKLYLDLTTVAEVLSVSISTVQKLTRDCPDFPKPRQISDRRVGWLTKELISWAERRPVSDLPPPANTSAKKSRLPSHQFF